MERLGITLLGGLQVRWSAGPAILLPARKTQALLAYLALHVGQPQPRDKLAALLWGDASDSRARHSLRQALVALRRALPRTNPPTLLEEGETVSLSPEAVDVDVGAFERLVAQGTPEALEQAMALYRGDLLEGLGAQEASFEEWLGAERERLRERAMEALARLLAHHVKAGALDRAVNTALRLLALDPLQEPVRRTLMRLYARQGRRGAALAQYQVCVDALQRELGVEPESETRVLYQEILLARRGPVSIVERPASDRRRRTTAAEGPPLVGRGNEVEQLHRALDTARQGHGEVAMILGEAGIGKSRLVEELTGSVGEEIRTLVGRCHETEQTLPYRPWVDALRSGEVTGDLGLRDGLEPVWRLELGRLLPEWGRTGVEGAAADDPLALFEAFAQLVRRLAEPGPLLLVLEDLHWADDTSLRLLSFVTRRILDRSVFIIGTARAEELAGVPLLEKLIDALDLEQRLFRVTLSPLSEPETHALVHARARAGVDETTLAKLGRQVWELSEGNPLVAVEAVRAQHEGGVAEPIQALELPERVRSLITSRLERLSEGAREMAGAAAVIGREFDFALLERVARVDEREAARRVEELVARRILQVVGEGLDFSHARVRVVAYGALLPPRRKLLHRDVASAIEELYAADLDPHQAALGRHCVAAEIWDKALEHLHRAGRYAAARSAHREAVLSFEEALVAARHLPGTRETTQHAIDVRFDLQSALVPLGALDRMLTLLREAEAMAEGLGDQRRLGWASAYMTHCLWWTGHADRAVECGRRALAIASDLDDRALYVLANVRLGQVYFALGEFGRAIDVYDRSLDALHGASAGERFGMPGVTSVSCRVFKAFCLVARGDFPAARTAAEEAVQIAEAVEHPFSIALAYHGRGVVELAQGHVPAATSSLERSLELCRRRNLVFLFTQVAPSLGQAYGLSGRAADGLALAQRAVEEAEAIQRMDMLPRNLAALGQIYLLAGQPADATESIGRALTLARAHKLRAVEADALRMLAETHAFRKPPDAQGAEAVYGQAITLAQALGMHPLEARCRLGLGRLYRQHGKGAQAAEHLAIAATMFRRMDMVASLERAEAELDGAGPR